MKYITVAIVGYCLIIQILRIIKLFLNPKFLQRKIFSAPGKIEMLFYYLAMICVLALTILFRLNIMHLTDKPE
ncbi:MAG: hypothetical protein JWN76_531 [Chitinophagaceae bacterium]|nr:hypothetical protein [Chitinophagaceae bacterium]